MTTGFLAPSGRNAGAWMSSTGSNRGWWFDRQTVGDFTLPTNMPNVVAAINTLLGYATATPPGADWYKGLYPHGLYSSYLGHVVPGADWTTVTPKLPSDLGSALQFPGTDENGLPLNGANWVQPWPVRTLSRYLQFDWQPVSGGHAWSGVKYYAKAVLYAGSGGLPGQDGHPPMVRVYIIARTKSGAPTQTHPLLGTHVAPGMYAGNVTYNPAGLVLVGTFDIRLPVAGITRSQYPVMYNDRVALDLPSTYASSVDTADTPVIPIPIWNASQGTRQMLNWNVVRDVHPAFRAGGNAPAYKGGKPYLVVSQVPDTIRFDIDVLTNGHFTDVPKSSYITQTGGAAATWWGVQRIGVNPDPSDAMVYYQNMVMPFFFGNTYNEMFKNVKNDGTFYTYNPGSGLNYYYRKFSMAAPASWLADARRNSFYMDPNPFGLPPECVGKPGRAGYAVVGWDFLTPASKAMLSDAANVAMFGPVI